MTTVRVEDNTTGTGQRKFNYSAGWVIGAALAQASGGQESYSDSVVNRTCTILFADASVVLGGITFSGAGIIGVQLDAEPEVLVDMYAATIAQKVMFSSAYMPGSHALKVRTTATKNALSTGVIALLDYVDFTDAPRTLRNVRTGLANALKAISGLRVYDFSADRIEPPAAVLSLPTVTDIAVSASSYTFPLWILVAKADDRTSINEITPYLDPNSATSIQKAIEVARTLGGTCDSVSVLRAQPQIATIAGTEYMAVEFTLEVI
ncbi:MAG: hypothetical protein ACR2M4_02915 [Actinomycetota bacterium]